MPLKDGYTLMHEHMSINLTEGDLGLDPTEWMFGDLKELYRYGVRNIVDLTNQSMGRDPERVKMLMEETGINIIMSTGHYLEQFMEPHIAEASVSELADEALRDLTVGIGGSGIKAEVIGEIAWSYEGAGKLEQKCWEAMCIAARKTGARVSTHPSRGILQIPQAEYLIAHGIAPEKIVIGHTEFYPDDASLKSLLDKGVYIGIDMIGKSAGKGDEYRADMVCKLKEWGALSRVFLSLDLCRSCDLRTRGGYGYPHLFDTFIPMLSERGITQDDIDLMFGQNPKDFFR